MNVLTKYFRNDAKALRCEVEISELYKQIRAIKRKQRKYSKLNHPLDAEVKQMFNDGIFTNYSHETDRAYRKLYQK